MIFGPKTGECVQLWYAKAFAHLWPFHGRFGVVRIVGSGKPRNHGIEIDGKIVVVPCGNIKRAEK